MSRDTQNRERTVLIAASHSDQDTWQPVKQKLPPSFRTVVLDGDAIASQRIPLKIELTDKGLAVEYNGAGLALNGIAAALHLRPNTPYATGQKWAHYIADKQARGIIYDTLWRRVPSKAWLNHPDKKRLLVGPLEQLDTARQAGFTIPHTLVTSDVGDIAIAFPHGAVHKQPLPILLNNDEALLTQSTHISDITALPWSELDPLTSYWQDHVEGRVWYAMAVGSQVFSVYWDKQNQPFGGRYTPGQLPARAQEQCRNYLGVAELGMGAFNLIENSDGVTCVSFDPDGHAPWLEQEFHMPISEAIARQLATIAMRD